VDPDKFSKIIENSISYNVLRLINNCTGYSFRYSFNVWENNDFFIVIIFLIRIRSDLDYFIVIFVNDPGYYFYFCK